VKRDALVSTHQPKSKSSLPHLGAIVGALQGALGAEDIDAVLSSVVNGVCSVAGENASAAITLVGQDGQLDASTYRVAGPLAEVMATFERPRATGGIGAWVIEHRQALFEEDVATGESTDHPPVRKKILPPGAYACLPLLSRGRAVGTLFVMFSTAFRFADEARAALETFASLAAQAIELNRLRQETQSQADRQVQLVRGISQRLLETWQQRDPIGALNGTLTEILRRVDEEVLQGQGVSAAVYVYEEEKGFYSGATRGPLADYMRDYPPRVDGAGGTALHAVQTKAPLFINDAAQFPAGIPALSEKALDSGVRALANLPLMVGGVGQETIVGILIINLSIPYLFDDDRRFLLGLFADQAAIALQAARVHRRRLREQAALRAISEAAISGCTDSSVQVITQRALELTGANLCAFWSVSSDGASLILMGYAPSDAGRNLEPSNLPINHHSINGHVFIQQNEHYAPNSLEDPYFRPGDTETRSAFCIPLTAREERLGTLYISSTRLDGFSAEYRDFIRQLGASAAITLQNTRLLERERQLRHQAEAFQALVAEIHSTTDLKIIGQTILDKLQGVIPFRTASLQLIYGDKRTLFASKGFDLDNADPVLIRPLSKDPLIAEIVASKSYRILSDLSRGDPWGFRLEKVESWCGVPLIVDHKVVGLLTLDHEDAGFYSEERHVQLLTSFANHAALALRDAQRNRDLNALNESALKLNETGEAGQVYENLVEAVVKTLECDYCTLFVARPDGMLVSEKSGGRLFPEPPKLRFAPGEGLAGWVYRDGKSLSVPDTSEDKRFIPASTESLAAARSMLLSPLRRGGKIIGVICADFDRPDAFDDNDLRLLDTLSSYAGVVLQNIEAFGDLRAMHDFAAGQAIKTGLDSIYLAAVEAVAQALHCSHSTFFALDRKSDVLVPVARVGSPVAVTAARRFGLGEGLAGYVLQTGQPLLVRNAAEDERFVPGGFSAKSDPRSLVLAPIRVNDQTVGVITADKDEIDGFIDRHLKTLETIALDAAIAIAARKAQDRLETVLKFQDSISQITGVKPLLQQVHEALSQVIDTSSFYIGLYDEERGFLDFPLAYERGQLVTDSEKEGASQYAPRCLGAGGGLSEWVMCRRRTLLVEDTDSWTEEGQDEINPALVSGLKCCLVAPMIYHNQIIGVLGLQNYEHPHMFTDDDQGLLAAIANHTAVAIANARQYDLINNRLDRRIKELEAVRSFQEAISDISSIEEELKDIYTSAAKAMKELMDTRNMFIALYDAERQEISFPLGYENGVRIPDESKVGDHYLASRRLGDRKGLTEWLIRHPEEPLLIERDFDNWARGQDDIEVFPIGTECWLGAPMVFRDQVIGIIALQSFSQESVFDLNHAKLLKTIAAQAAIAIDNAHKYDLINNRLDRRIKELEAVSRFQQKISSVSPMQ
jgi:GAF domain-containing protein